MSRFNENQANLKVPEPIIKKGGSEMGQDSNKSLNSSKL